MTENEPLPPAPEEKPIDLESEVDQARKEADEYKHKYLHNLADMENARKRLYKERQTIAKDAIENLLRDILNPIDHLENALKHADKGSEELKHWALGFQMILNQLKDVLACHGVFSFDALGTPFDPHLHEAVEMIVTTDQPPGVVIEEPVRGYKIGDRILRPARVKVSKAPPPQPEEEKVLEK